jgi:hypothetical protein
MSSSHPKHLASLAVKGGYMAGQINPESRSHDLLTAVLGAFAAGVLISSPWQVDTSGPYPFYKGALIFPLFALGLMVLASIPSALRMLKPPEGAVWRIDGEGAPAKTLLVFLLLVAFLAGIPLIGLEISSVLFLGITLFYLGHRSPKVFILIPLILTGVNYILFKYLLDVYFPTPLLYALFGG